MMNKLKGRKKTSVMIALVFTLFLLIGNSVYAFDRDWNDGSTFDWSPDLISTSVTSYSSGSLRVNTYFEFDSTAAQKNNTWLYFTFEHNNAADGLDGDLQFSNIPNPHFDWDDDNGDGYEEESEVVEGGNSLVAYKDYYLTTWWENTKSTTHPGGTIYMTAQNSVYNFITGEHEGLNYDLIETETYSPVGPN